MRLMRISQKGTINLRGFILHVYFYKTVPYYFHRGTRYTSKEPCHQIMVIDTNSVLPFNVLDKTEKKTKHQVIPVVHKGHFCVALDHISIKISFCFYDLQIFDFFLFFTSGFKT